MPTLKSAPVSAPLHRLAAATALSLCMALAGCAGVYPGESYTAEAHDSANDEALMIIDSSAGDLAVTELASLEFPWGMAYLPDGDLLITEKPGRLRVFDGQSLSDPIRGVPDVAYRNQGGLLDVAVDPDFAANGYIYLFVVQVADAQPDDPSVDADPRLGPYVDTEDTTAKHGAVVRARLTPDGLQGVQEIWRQNEDVIGLGHFGGRLVFAPDGKLIITSGERQKFSPAQDPNSNLGKIIRINSDGTIPSDNPYARYPGARAAVWSSGHRNPLGLDIEPGSGALWIHEMGPLFGDELNRPEPRKDYGWPTVSNGEHYNKVEIPHHETAPGRFERPEFYWRPAISPSGLTFYDGDMFSDWSGDALIGGLSSQALIRVDMTEDGVAGDERLALNLRVRDVEQAMDGSIYVLTDYEDGALLRLNPAKN